MYVLLYVLDLLDYIARQGSIDRKCEYPPTLIMDLD